MVGPTGLVVILYLVGLDAHMNDAVPRWSASRPEVNLKNADANASWTSRNGRSS